MDNNENEKNIIKEEKDNKKKKVTLIITLPIIVLLLVFLIVYSFVTKQIDFKDTKFKITNIEHKSEDDYIKNNETFIVETEKGSLDDVKKHLYIEPAINYDIKKVSRNKYEVSTKDIPSDSIINLKYLDNEVVEDKWAFQSTKDLTVTSIYPANNTSNNSTYTTIEIVFSYPNVEDINNSILIDPPVEGKFVQNGRVWILKPDKPLKENTTYTITVNNTIKNSSEKIKESYKSTFSTYVNNNTSTTKINYNSNTIDNIATFKPSDNPMFVTTGNITRVEMLKFASSEDFKKYIDNDTTYKTTSLGDVPIEKLENNLYKVNKTFKTGYYLEKAYLSTGELHFTIPVQVNDLQAYLLTTQNDLLVWTGSNNSVLKDVEVEYGSKNSKTDNNGLTIIKNYNDKSNKVKYVKVGKENPIYIGIDNKDAEQYPNAYVYTDRPLYKNTDDIQIFGYIPFKYFEDEASKEDFVLSINEERIPIEITDDGVFTTAYHLDNMKSEYYNIDLKYKDKSIASRTIEVKQYEKEMYNFKINMDKNYIKAGDKFHFTVAVEHISGVMVPDKEIQVIYKGQPIRGITNSEGIASFDLDTSLEPSDEVTKHSESVNVKSTLTESSQNGYIFNFYILDRYLNQKQTNYDKKTKTLTSSIYNITDTKQVKNIEWNTESLEDSPYEGEAQVEIIETETTRTIKGYTYNSITKENVPNYNYNSVTNTVKNDKYKIKSGKINYKIDYDYKKNTKDITYSYRIVFTLKDKNGKNTRFTNYLDTNTNNSNINGYYSPDTYYYGLTDYNLYTYYMQREEKSYSVDEQVIRDLYKFSGELENNDNKILLVKYKNNIIDEKIVYGTKKIKTSFDDKNRPGMKIVGAYLKDGVFHRLPSEYLDYNESNSKLDISINTNKKTYKPQDEVELNLKVTKKGKGIKSKVNISVVDEGVFKAQEDYKNILSNLYYNKNYYQYTYSTYRDYSLYLLGGGAGSTNGGPRADFGDTIIFKTIDTDNDGNAKLKFKLNDSITSFRITAHATTSNVDADATHTNIESSLPVSISFAEPRGLKTSDDVVLNALGIGSSKEPINYVFSIDGIKKKITAKGNISQTVYANFGKLKAGNYKVTISAKTSEHTDKVQYKFTVGNTQTEISVKNTSLISKNKKIKPTKNPIKLEIYRNSFKKYDKYLEILKNTNEERLDTKYTYIKALEYENKYNKTSNAIDMGDLTFFRTDNGYKYLPGEETDYILTAILAYYDKELRLDKSKYYSMLSKKELADRMNAYLVLAAHKEPILDDLNKVRNDMINGGQKDKLALAYIFLGDYNNARMIKDLNDEGLNTYISTFIHKDVASANIDDLYLSDKANRYIYFSIISFFENNNIELNSKEEVTLTYGNKTKVLKISPLGKERLSIYQNDLKELKFKTKYKDIYLNYYYEGTIDEVDKDNKTENIIMSLSTNTPKLGDIANINVDISNIANNTTLVLYLPNGVRLSSGFKSDFAYVTSNTPDKINIRIGEKKSNSISIPVYFSSPGEYKIEPIILKAKDKYQISNSINLKIE